MREGNLHFTFPENTEKLDADTPGVPKPYRMCMVDFLVKENERLLLVEVKDPSKNAESACEPFPVPQTAKKVGSSKPNAAVYAQEDLLLKARDSYTYLHLMGEDGLSMDFAVVIGIERIPSFDPKLLVMLDILRKKIIQEGPEPWKRKYIEKVYVCSVDSWNKIFSEYPCRRIVENAD